MESYSASGIPTDYLDYVKIDNDPDNVRSKLFLFL